MKECQAEVCRVRVTLDHSILTIQRRPDFEVFSNPVSHQVAYFSRDSDVSQQPLSTRAALHAGR